MNIDFEIVKESLDLSSIFLRLKKKPKIFRVFWSKACCVYLSLTNWKNYCFLKVWMVSKNVTKKKKTNETIKWELLNSLQENDDVEEEGIN